MFVKEKKGGGIKVKHQILWVSYIAFIRQYQTMEKIKKDIHCKGSYTYTIHKTLMGDSDVPKNIDENSDMRICNNKQNFKCPYISSYKNSLQNLF